MLGDAKRLLKIVASEKNLRRAFRYALQDRPKCEWYYDPSEIEAVNEDEIVTELLEELHDAISYRPRPAYAYFPPKNGLCYRRMIYLPFKELVVRCALVSVIADLLDPDLSDNCFANRRARGTEKERRFLQDFAEDSWPRFCQWQRECASETRYKILLRTDISAFYDSISHKYVQCAIAEQLAVSQDSDFMSLFHILLEVPVISYSHLTNEAGPPETIHQGLPIGSNTEGVLANLYLKHVDDAMLKMKDVQYGRYNDDIRIFAESRETGKEAMLVLQQHLLKKGLNLNASKTKIAEGNGIEDLRSKAYESTEYGSEEDDVETQPGQAKAMAMVSSQRTHALEDTPVRPVAWPPVCKSPSFASGSGKGQRELGRRIRPHRLQPGQSGGVASQVAEHPDRQSGSVAGPGRGSACSRHCRQHGPAPGDRGGRACRSRPETAGQPGLPGPRWLGSRLRQPTLFERD